jgi:hypothetical protein
MNTHHPFAWAKKRRTPPLRLTLFLWIGTRSFLFFWLLLYCSLYYSSYYHLITTLHLVFYLKQDLLVLHSMYLNILI